MWLEITFYSSPSSHSWSHHCKTYRYIANRVPIILYLLVRTGLNYCCTGASYPFIGICHTCDPGDVRKMICTPMPCSFTCVCQLKNREGSKIFLGGNSLCKKIISPDIIIMRSCMPGPLGFYKKGHWTKSLDPPTCDDQSTTLVIELGYITVYWY